MAPDATGDASNIPAPAVFRREAKDYLRTLGTENRSNVKNARWLAARCILAGMVVTGAIRRHRGGDPTERVRGARRS